jgi:16S rRNA C967 or C1407 C5-methylase (RsmB/RsmF family)/NOL1/NOP2/fmu family ribosome biogenesis protein
MNLPVDFEQYTRQLLGEQRYVQLTAGLQSVPSVTVRLHPLKAHSRLRVDNEPVPWATNAYYLQERPAFTYDPLFHAGCYYVQDASSMFLEQALRVVQSHTSLETVLDLCAAPGGKSTLLRSLIPHDALLVANEPMHPRDKILQENLTKWGYTHTIVTNNYPSAFRPLRGFFDLVVADVPCSGEGMFRKDEQAIAEWSRENVQLCKERQQEILREIWGTVKSNGFLLYSTCTFNRAENEENVDWMVKEFGAQVLPIPTQPEWNIASGTHPEDAPVYHFFPGSTRGEGIFFALLQKPEVDEEPFVWSGVKRNEKGKKNARGNKLKPAAIDYTLCQTWLRDAESYQWEIKEDTLTALPNGRLTDMQAVGALLNTLSRGIEVAVRTPKGWQPTHALAMSEALNMDVFPRIEVTYNQALSYLRHESLTVDADTPRGYLLICYRTHPLGFGKCVGGRINNLYPQEWRIRSGYTTPFELLE